MVMRKFGRGDVVEIIGNVDGYFGSYFGGRVVEKLGEDKGYVVKYESLVEKENNPKKKVKEKVEEDRVRPIPPEMRVWGFDVMDVVDAYDDGGWWMGRVTHKDLDGYTVYFDSCGYSLVYKLHHLRVHQDFVDSHWVSSHSTYHL